MVARNYRCFFHATWNSFAELWRDRKMRRSISKCESWWTARIRLTFCILRNNLRWFVEVLWQQLLLAAVCILCLGLNYFGNYSIWLFLYTVHANFQSNFWHCQKPPSPPLPCGFCPVFIFYPIFDSGQGMCMFIVVCSHRFVNSVRHVFYWRWQYLFFFFKKKKHCTSRSSRCVSMEKVFRVKLNFHLLAAYIGIKCTSLWLMQCIYIDRKFADCLYGANRHLSLL